MLILLGIVSLIVQLVVSYVRRESLRDMTGDPWDGRTLEWSTSSPPPAYNFAFTPRVYDNDTWADMKKSHYRRPREGFIPIHMPKNTGAGFVIAALCAALRLRADLAHVAAGGGLSSSGCWRRRSSIPSTTTGSFYIPADEVAASRAPARG